MNLTKIKKPKTKKKPLKLRLNKGTNISHWLSQSDARGTERKQSFSEEDCRFLAGLGLDHLRLPLDEEQLWDENGKQHTEAWELLHMAIDWCLENGLNVVLDLHILRSHYFNADTSDKTLFTNEDELKRFARFWRELSDEFSYLPVEKVGYELLNEPVADTPEEWNRVLRAPYDAVREHEPNRIIALGSNRWNQTATFPDFKPPENDENLILVFHYYNPMPVTHYNASWMPCLKEYCGPLQYPGHPIPEDEFARMPEELALQLSEQNSYFDINVMDAQLQPALRKSQETGLPLWCNEFGVINKAPDAIRSAWYRDIMTLFHKYDIGWSNWDFHGDFGFVNSDYTLNAAGKILFL